MMPSQDAQTNCALISSPREQRLVVHHTAVLLGSSRAAMAYTLSLRDTTVSDILTG